MEMRDAWRLTFNNISVPEEGDYLLEIAYQLSFESPKTQFHLYISVGNVDYVRMNN